MGWKEMTARNMHARTTPLSLTPSADARVDTVIILLPTHFTTVVILVGKGKQASGGIPRSALFVEQVRIARARHHKSARCAPLVALRLRLVPHHWKDARNVFLGCIPRQLGCLCARIVPLVPPVLAWGDPITRNVSQGALPSTATVSRARHVLPELSNLRKALHSANSAP